MIFEVNLLKYNRIATLIVTALLLTTAFIVFTPTSNAQDADENSNSLPPTNLEYASGALTVENSPLKVWYSWVNTSGTQIIYYALYTTPDYPYPVPIANVVGQHFTSSDGTEVFVASALSELEIYRDFNGDGVPQTSKESGGENEVLYYMYSNMSQSYTASAIEKEAIDDVTHYRWSFTYENAYAYLQNASARVGVIARMNLEHLAFNYDFSVNGNVSDLKTSFDIGKVINLEVLEPSQFSGFDELSLALLYTTATYTSKAYSTSVNGQQYDSSTAESSVAADIAEIKVGEVKAYDYMFGGTYTLSNNASNQTYTANIETYTSKAQAAPITGLPAIYGPTVRSISLFKDQLNLAALFGGSWPNVNSNYEASSLVYRICFPVWGGSQIVHDPDFVGYIFNTQEIPELPTTLLLIPLLIAASAAAIIIVKKRKLPSLRSFSF